MPLYECECAKCGVHADYHRTVAERHDTPVCRCGGKTKLVIMPTFVQDDIPAYVSHTTGRVIGSRTKRRDDLRRSNCREWEGFSQESKEAARRLAYDEQRREQRLEQGVEKIYHQLPVAHRRAIEGR